MVILLVRDEVVKVLFRDIYISVIYVDRDTRQTCSTTADIIIYFRP